MFNINFGRIKSRLKAEIREAKKFFVRQTSHEKTVAQKVMSAPEPKMKMSRRGMARLKTKIIAENAARLLRRRYYGGQFSPFGSVYFGQGRRVRFSFQDIVRARRKWAV